MSEHGDDAVEIEADLPGNLRWANVPPGMTAAERDDASTAVLRSPRAREHRAGHHIPATVPVTFAGSITAVTPGPAEIRVRARVTPPGGFVDVAEDLVRATAGEPGKPSAMGNAATAGAGALTPLTKEPAPQRTTNGRAVPFDQSPTPKANAFANSCVTGALFYTDNVGVFRPSTNATDEVRKNNTLLVLRITGWDGRYNLCYTNTSLARIVTVRFMMR